jgi:hypothetical protein
MKEPEASPFWTGIAHGFAVLAHFMLILVIPAFLWSFLKKPRSSRRATSHYLVGLGLVIGLAYGGIAIYLGSLREFITWFTDPAWKPQTNFLSQNYLHWNLASNFSMSWNSFVDSLVRPLPSWPSWTALLSSTLMAVFLITMIAESIKLYRQRDSSDRLIALWLWILGLSSLQFFYSSDTRFRVLWLPALFLIVLEVQRAAFPRIVWRWAA